MNDTNFLESHYQFHIMEKTKVLVFLFLVTTVSANCQCRSNDLNCDSNRKPPLKSPRIAELSAQFENGGDKAKPLDNRYLKEDILLELYALNQLGKLGNVDATRPGRLDWKRKAKLEALNNNKETVEEKPKPNDVKKQPEITLQEKFKQAATNVNKLKKSPKNDELVELYALYKQATVGNINTPDPGRWNLKEKIKWDAWKHKQGTNSEKAKQDYVNKVNELIGRFGIS